MIDWDFNYRTCSGVIRFPDGREVFLQGDEANDLDNAIEECETCDEIERTLEAYDHIAEMPTP